MSRLHKTGHTGDQSHTCARINVSYWYPSLHVLYKNCIFKHLFCLHFWKDPYPQQRKNTKDVICLAVGMRSGTTLNDHYVARETATTGMKMDAFVQHLNAYKSTFIVSWTGTSKLSAWSDRPRSERCRKTTSRDERYVVTISRRNCLNNISKIDNRKRNATRAKLLNCTVNFRQELLVPVTLPYRRQRQATAW